MAHRKSTARKLDYHDRKRAIAYVGEALAQHFGWELLGYHPDNSDPMTDYYDPARWEGVATHSDFPGVIACVGVQDWQVNNKSGKPEVRARSVEAGLCPSCTGTGEDPSGVTYAEACADFNKYHFNVRAKERGAVSLLPRVISPLHFFEDGRPKCLRCGGSGKQMASEHYTAFTWPAFHATPQGRAWHVEVNGRIVASGTGLAECADWHNGRAAACGMADKITKAARAALAAPDEQPAQAAPDTDGPARVEYDRDWTWVYFSGKPAEAVRDGLKALGFRFSGRRVGWYATQHVPQEQLAGIL